MAEIIIPELSQLITEVRAIRTQMDRIEALLNEKEGKEYLALTHVAKELKFSDATIKTWCVQGRRHPVSRKLIVLKTYKSEGGRYRVLRKDLEAFKEIFTTK
ncbi:hypothetical protein [Siphonobacter sp. SORGH_AS_1065]|uniref:hypothetical protein n=1 Tax=Siphonobacter sp. SORGH_AS_1065 TaxID=3041795 RepID=UPI0027879BFB|nr:hypothetical protein [Siphonobacter sp. SORGH_AS_1065]MDQ1087185.1 anti-sigma-K factor RskA [Siphonobacter sp. SORGH_AS_1065]